MRCVVRGRKAHRRRLGPAAGANMVASRPMGSKISILKPDYLYDVQLGPECSQKKKEFEYRGCGERRGSGDDV